MSRFCWVALVVLTACEQSGTAIDAGAACIADDDQDFAWPGTADVSVGEPIPLIVQAGFGCSTQVVSSECIVDIEGDEAIISSVFELTTPGRLPWAGQDNCLTLGTALCDMPPSTQGITRIRYGANSMDITVPGESEGCISAQAGVTAR